MGILTLVDAKTTWQSEMWLLAKVSSGKSGTEEFLDNIWWKLNNPSSKLVDAVRAIFDGNIMSRTFGTITVAAITVAIIAAIYFLYGLLADLVCCFVGIYEGMNMALQTYIIPVLIFFTIVAVIAFCSSTVGVAFGLAYKITVIVITTIATIIGGAFYLNYMEDLIA